MRRRLLLSAAVVTIPTIASANAAMGLGLERWDLHYWYAYVVATIIAEAWLIGRWIGYSWAKSLGLSALANSITGLFCGGLGLFAPFLHTAFVGTPSNPNPLLDALLILTACALPSAVAEFVVWSRAKKLGLTWRVIWVHFAVIPLALAILLIPPRPYKSLEGFTEYHRRMSLIKIGKALGSYATIKGSIPKASTPEELVRALGPYLEDDRDETILGLYSPEFGRFSLGEDRRHPYEFNSVILGRPVKTTEDEDHWAWYVRPPGPTHDGWGLEINLTGGQARPTNDGEARDALW